MNIVWFKRDLRLVDHEPLAAAIDQGEPLLLLYIIEPMLIRDAHYRGRHWHFIAQSLNELNQQLQPYGATIQVLEGEGAIAKNRDLMGATNPQEAAAGTIRADFATTIDANAVHGSDSPESAAREIAYFFAANEVCER